ncbi:MAG: phage protein NinX family protein [Comamonadaceae bacterium]
MIVKRLEGALLDYWVAKSLGLKLLAEAPLSGERHDPDSGHWHPDNYHPSIDWSHGGPIVSNEWYVIEDILIEWFGADWTGSKAIMNFSLSWFMRAYVASQFGDEVEDVAGTKVSWSQSRSFLAQLPLDTRRGQRATMSHF